METRSNIETLCAGKTVFVENKYLENIKSYYREGCTSLVIFEPPKVGTDILLLEHMVNPRNYTENNKFGLESGFDRMCIIYHVERYILKEGVSFYHPDNQVILSYRVFRSDTRYRKLEFRDFNCGFYCARELTEEEKVMVTEHRRIINEEFDIYRF